MRTLTTEEKEVIRKAKDLANQIRAEKRRAITQQLCTLPGNTPRTVRAELDARREALTPITGSPVHVKLGTAVLPPVDYEWFRKVVRSVRNLAVQRVFVEGGHFLVLEYLGNGVEGRMEFISPPEYMELDGLLPVVEL